MSSALILKDEDLMSSPSVVGYNILKLLKDKNKVKMSIFDVADHFKNEKWFSPKTLYFAMIFLFSTGIIEFRNSYIVMIEKC